MFKKFYEDELEFVRGMASEFAESYPESAAELDINGHDPDVERLFQGFSFLSARIRESLEGTVHQLVHPLLNQVWPHVLRPSPAACIVEFKPRAGMFKEVLRVKKGALLQSDPVEGTPCQFRTCYPVNVAPVSMERVRLEIPDAAHARLELRLKVLPSATLSRMSHIPLRFYLHGNVHQAYGLYEALLQSESSVHVRAKTAEGKVELERVLPSDMLRPVGWSEDEALLPYPSRTRPGYRHLHEYFLFPEKYLFVELAGLQWLEQAKESEVLEIFFRLKTLPRSSLSLSAENIRLFCVPAVNLFEHRVKALRVGAGNAEHLIRPEPSKPGHFEIFSIDRISGYDKTKKARVEFRPYFDAGRDRGGEHFYQVLLRSHIGGESGPASSESDEHDNGLDAYLRLVGPDGRVSAFEGTLALEMTVTNRGLPSRLEPGTIRNPTKNTPALVTFSDVSRLSPPAPATASREDLGYFLAQQWLRWDMPGDRESLRRLLTLYLFPASRDGEAVERLQRILNCIEKVQARPEPWLLDEPPTLMKGTHLQIDAHESLVGHSGVLYLFGTALMHYLSAMLPANTFVRLTLNGLDQGMELTWEPMKGKQPLI